MKLKVNLNLGYGILIGIGVVLLIIVFGAKSPEPQPTKFTSTIYLDKNQEGPRFGGDSILYLEVAGPDSGFVTPLATAWECAGSY